VNAKCIDSDTSQLFRLWSTQSQAKKTSSKEFAAGETKFSGSLFMRLSIVKVGHVFV
jgi:hypothetical protein